MYVYIYVCTYVCMYASKIQNSLSCQDILLQLPNILCKDAERDETCMS